jgi:pimeloyl-ACP methyl ester carboxylesterase
VPTRDAENASLCQQVDDLRALIHWVKVRSGQNVTLFGVSLGATMSLLVANREADAIASVIAVSPDINTAESDANVTSFLDRQTVLAADRTLESRVRRLATPPYTDPQRFGLWARVLSDLRVIELSSYRVR